jgi:V8-like Glu-specific endopeptidase
VFDPGVSNYNAYPHRTNGKVFFTKATGGNFVCSGTVVSADNRSTVWTAGHCVSNGAGSFHLNWIFVPAYKDGARPFKTWTAKELNTRTEWHSFGNFEEVVAGAIVNPLSGVLHQNRVGSPRISFNQPYP